MSIYKEIQEKPIIITGQGPSIAGLRDNIQLFNKQNVIWGSLNRFHITEQEILSQIGVDFDIVWFSALLRYAEMHKQIKEVGCRGSLLMTKCAVAEYFNFPANIYVSDFGNGFSSLFAMLCALIKLGARNIYLIGFDGHAMSPGEVYYGQQKMHSDRYETRMMSIAKDTKMMNMFFWEYVEYALNTSRYSINITNLEGSSITCFERLEIDELAKRSGSGILPVTANKKLYPFNFPRKKVRVIKYFISPRYGNVEEGRIIELPKSSAEEYIKHNLVEYLDADEEGVKPVIIKPKKFKKKKQRKPVLRKKIDSYYTIDHQELLTEISKLS